MTHRCRKEAGETFEDRAGCAGPERESCGDKWGIRTTEIKGSSWGPGVACKPHVGCRAEPLSGEMADSIEGLSGHLSQAQDRKSSPRSGSQPQMSSLWKTSNSGSGLAWPLETHP